MLESEYQALLIKKLKIQYPDCIIVKNDPNYIQGIPDLVVLWNGRAAVLEVKASAKAKERPNQRWYIEHARGLGFYSAFVYPENEEQVLAELQNAFGA